MISKPRFSTSSDGGDFSAKPTGASAKPTGADADRQQAADDAAGDPLSQLAGQFAELKAYAWQRWAVRLDRLSLSFRRLLLAAVAGMLALMGLVTGLIVSVVMLLDGAAGGIAELLDGRRWLANLIVGAAALSLAAIVFAIGVAVVERASHKRARAKYERTQLEQRRRFGHGATERAAHGAAPYSGAGHGGKPRHASGAGPASPAGHASGAGHER